MKLSSNLLKGVFLIVLTIIGTTVENTFSCQTLKVLHTNPFAKQVIIFCLIYFTIDFTDDKNSHPYDTFKSTVNIWLLYIVLSKQNLYFTAFNFTLLAILYVLFDYGEYIKDKLKENITSTEKNDLLNKKDKIHSMKEICKNIVMVSAISGFVFYYFKERKEHSKDFDYVKFLFGNNKCDHM